MLADCHSAETGAAARNFALAHCSRALGIDAVAAAQSGHPGAPIDVIGLDGFGASAPAQTLYDIFGITRAAIVARTRALLND